MKFQIQGTFEAEDIDDAMKVLAEHLVAVLNGEDTDIGVCDIEIGPVEE